MYKSNSRSIIKNNNTNLYQEFLESLSLLLKSIKFVRIKKNSDERGHSSHIFGIRN